MCVVADGSSIANAAVTTFTANRPVGWSRRLMPFTAIGGDLLRRDQQLRAADGAGLPAREPRATDDDGTEDGEQPAGGFDLNALVAQVVPMLVMSLGKGKMPDLASVLDWRKAQPEAKQLKSARPDGPGDVAPSPQASTEALPPIDPQTMAHFIAIQSALKPEESAMAREVASTLGPAELRAWFDELSKLSIPQAVQKIRVLIAGNTEAVS